MAREIASKNVFRSNISYNTQADLSPEGTTLGIGKAHDQGSGNVQRSSRIFDNGSGCQKMDNVVSDMNLASRKAEEAANRRLQASSWLQQMVGPVDLPLEPSEEELRVCLQNGLSLCRLINKVHPGAVPKIVENFAPSSPMEAALSAFQYFENVRNFLVAVEDLKLPSFEASDLEQSSLLTGSVAKVVDCVLAIKAFHEWKQNGESAPWKLGAVLRSPGGANICSPGPFTNGCNNTKPASTAALKFVNQPRKRWAQSEFEFSGEYGMHPPEDSASLWIREISLKVSDIFQMENTTNEGHALDSHGAKNGQKCTSPQPLLNLIRTVLDDKKPEEIPKVVEFMLMKVMEEFERSTLSHGEKVKDLENISKNVHKQDEPLFRLRGPKSLSLEHEGLKVLVDQLQQVKRLKGASESTKQDVLKLQIHWKEQMENLESHLQKLAAAAAGYQKVLEENRQLYNQVQDLKGNIRVYCRVRPFLNGVAGRKGTVDYIGENGEIMIVKPKKQGKDVSRSFIFNKVFDISASQEEVFLDTQPLIRSVLDGYNVCIFAYGQTGSGKTYTMSGPNSSSENLGVNYRALNDLFQISQARMDVFKYQIGVQMIEIYNEQVRDLLTADGANRKLEIRNKSQQNGLNVPDATMLSVNDTPDVLEVMKMGYKNRTVGCTAMNERSSRSHSVLTVHVKGTDMSSGNILSGCLHLVDLAGSERVDKSEATGDRLKEAQHINKSLSALGDVISALIQKSSHIPYRNSKLTHLLQDALGGQAKTLMFVHINPDLESYGETISTLKFAERVASVELGAARSNKECGEVRNLKEQITSLKDALAKKDAEIDRLSKSKSMKASSQQLNCNSEKLKTQPQRKSVEELEQSNETFSLDEADIFLDPFAEKFEPKEALASSTTWARQAISVDNQLKQAPSKLKDHLLHLKENPLDWESLSPETSVQVTNHKYKLARRHEPRNGLILHQEWLEVTELEDGLPKLQVDRTPMKNGFSETCETLALSKQTIDKLAVILNSEGSAPKHIVSTLDVLDCQVACASEFLHTSDGEKHNYHAESGHEHHNTENEALSNIFERDDETDFFEGRKHYDTPNIALSIDQGAKVFQMKNPPPSMKQPYKIDKKRSPLQAQNPTNERRLFHGVQTQSPLRRSLAFGTVVTPGVQCFNVRRASVAEK